MVFVTHNCVPSENVEIPTIVISISWFLNKTLAYRSLLIGSLLSKQYQNSIFIVFLQYTHLSHFIFLVVDIVRAKPQRNFSCCCLVLFIFPSFTIFSLHFNVVWLLYFFFRLLFNEGYWVIILFGIEHKKGKHSHEFS